MSMALFLALKPLLFVCLILVSYQTHNNYIVIKIPERSRDIEVKTKVSHHILFKTPN